MSIRHNCEHSGCYIKVHTPDWAPFDRALTGKNAIGDIDGITEANGRLLILEWKGIGVDKIDDGQRIMFEKSTKLMAHLTVFVVNGITIPIEARRIRIYKGGKIIADEKKGNDRLFQLIKNWEIKARKGEI